MISGRVGQNRKAIIPIDLLDAVGRLRRLNAMIDTGFDLELALPGITIRSLGLTWRDEIEMTLADGQTVRFQLYGATIIWHELRREIRVLETSDEAIIGADLLWGSAVTMQMREGGHVFIEELPAS